MMFEKFTERGRKVIVYAREEAERLQNDYLGTEHILLGTLREEDGIPVAVELCDPAGNVLHSSG